MSEDINSFPIKKKTIAQLDTGIVTPQSLLAVSIDGVTQKVTAQAIADLGSGLSQVSWDDVTGKPTFATVAETGDYADLANTPDLSGYAATGDLATVAFTGDYSDLIGKPTLGTASTQDTGTGAGQVPILDGSGLLDPAVIPVSFVNKMVLGLDADLLTTTGLNAGDVYKATDTGKSYMLLALPSSDDTNWSFFTDITPDWSIITSKPSTFDCALTAGYLGFGSGSNLVTGSSNLIYDTATNSLYIKGGSYLVGDADPQTVDISHGRLRVNGGTKTSGDAGASFVLAQTWNDAAMIGYLHTTNVTDTASDDNSFLQHYLVNSYNVWGIRKDGAFNCGSNTSTPWSNGVGAMEAMSKPIAAPTNASATDSVIRWFDDTDKRYKYIDDTGTVRTIAATSDVSTPTLSSVLAAGNTSGAHDIVMQNGAAITTNSGHDLVLRAVGAAAVRIGASQLAFPQTDGSPNQVMITDGSAILGWTSLQTITDMLPTQSGHSNQFLKTNGSGTLSWAATGTVTSVAATVPSFLSISGSPITSSGTLAITLATQNANLIFAGPTTGSAATPTFRSIVAADLPTVPIAQGGTGQTTAAAAFDGLAPSQTSNSGKYLTTNGTTTSWGTVTVTRTTNTQTGTTYTSVSGDSGNCVTLNNASAITVTVSGLTANTVTEFIQLGAGQVTFATGTLTIRHVSNLTKIAGKWGRVWITVIGTDAIMDGAMS